MRAYSLSVSGSTHAQIELPLWEPKSASVRWAKRSRPWQACSPAKPSVQGRGWAPGAAGAVSDGPSPVASRRASAYDGEAAGCGEGGAGDADEVEPSGEIGALYGEGNGRGGRGRAFEEQRHAPPPHVEHLGHDL